MSTCTADYENDDSYEFQGQCYQPMGRNGSAVNRYHEFEYVFLDGQFLEIHFHNFPYHTETHRYLRAWYVKQYASALLVLIYERKI